MRSRRWIPTLAGRVLALQALVVVLLLLIVAVISYRQQTRDFLDVRGSQMLATSESVANTSVVRDRIGLPDATRTLASVATRAGELSGASVVTIAGPDGRVIASTSPVRVGDIAPLGSSDVRMGRAWIGNIDTSTGLAVSGHAPVMNDDGEVVGVVLSEDAYPSGWDRLDASAPDLVLYLAVGAGLGLIGAWLLARSVKRGTRGLEPEEIGRLVDHREALLHSIAEAVVAVDPDGRITVANDGAQTLLDLPSDAEGRRVSDLAVPPQVRDLLLESDDAEAGLRHVDGKVIVLSRARATSRGEGIGTVTTLRDRTEVAALRDRLSTNVTITNTLRAQTHEFANQLHTIAGLIELGEHDEVRRLIGSITERRAAITSTIDAHVEPRMLAALLVAKATVAAEAGVGLDLDPDSHLAALGPDLESDLSTVLGNLVDNAVDAVRGLPDPRVHVRLDSGGDSVALTVRDNGPGIAQGVRDHVFDRGFSTKPTDAAGRGYGLSLVRVTVERRHGTLTMETSDVGTTFDVRVPIRESRL